MYYFGYPTIQFLESKELSKHRQEIVIALFIRTVGEYNSSGLTVQSYEEVCFISKMDINMSILIENAMICNAIS